MSEVVGAKPQEEYEDDFEKDLDWLISEGGPGEDQVNKASVLQLFISSFTFPLLLTILESRLPL